MARVLVVDDHPDTAESFAALLCAWGHDARAATDGAEAVRLAAEFRPDFALIDVRMPCVDGYAVARCLRATPGLEGALLVAMTGYVAGDNRRPPRGDFDAFLLKPVDHAALSLLLRTLSAPPGGASVYGASGGWLGYVAGVEGGALLVECPGSGARLDVPLEWVKEFGDGGQSVRLAKTCDEVRGGWRAPEGE
jgi:CheY-like chemotaxis protein